MSESITVEGKEYISSKRASQLSGYAQDYIGQLARSSQIDAQRIGGLWYVSMESLDGYKAKAESFKPNPPERKPSVVDPEALISFDGKDYISAARAAKLTGYHQDYVGQLARSGAVLSRQIGNRWYVERDGILAHKKSKDALLAAVQSESVGLMRPADPEASQATPAPANAAPLMTYVSEQQDLMPVLKSSEETYSAEAPLVEEPEEEENPIAIPIRVLPPKPSRLPEPRRMRPVSQVTGSTASYGLLAASALTIVIVLSFGFSTLKTQSIYSAGTKGGIQGLGAVANTAGAAAAFSSLGDFIERLVVPELIYRRAD